MAFKEILNYFCLHISLEVEKTPSQNLVKVIYVIYTSELPPKNLVLDGQHGKGSSFAKLLSFLSIENELFSSGDVHFDIIF